MRDKELYREILGVRSPCKVADVELSLGAGEVKLFVEQEAGAQQCCPKCGMVCAGYDRRRREWQHLETCQFKTILVADAPRVECLEHGVVTVVVPWAEGRRGSLSGSYKTLSAQQKEAIESVAMDMWPAYIRATLDAIPNAWEKIAFDKFHVAKYLGDAVDTQK